MGKIDRQVWSVVVAACVTSAVVALTACRDSAKSTLDGAAAATGSAAASASASAAPSASALTKATGPHAAAAQPGKCHRGMCDLGKEYCCDAAGSAEHQCVSRASGAKMPHCFVDDPTWLIAMECNQFTGCGGKKCCKRHIAGHPEMTQDICADSCEIAEVCGHGGACKDGQTCKSDDNERSGGICTGAAKAEPECTPGASLYAEGLCRIICTSSATMCMNGDTCTGSKGGEKYCKSPAPRPKITAVFNKEGLCPPGFDRAPMGAACWKKCKADTECGTEEKCQDGSCS